MKHLRRYVSAHALLTGVMLASSVLSAAPWKSAAAVRTCGNAAIAVLALIAAGMPVSLARGVSGWHRMRGDRRRLLYPLMLTTTAAVWLAAVCILVRATGGV